MDTFPAALIRARVKREVAEQIRQDAVVETQKAVIEAVRRGHSIVSISKASGFSRETIYAILRKEGLR